MKINHHLFAALFAAVLSLATAGPGSAAQPDGKTAAGGKAPLGERLAREFPVLENSLAARSATFETTTRTLSGREVTGLTVSSVQMNPPGVSPEGGGMRVALKPEEEAALRSLAEREGKGGEFKVFFPAHYTESIAVEGGGVSAVLRPLGARPAPAQAENGQVVYYEAYRETDSLHVIGEGRSEEFLYLRSEDAPRRFEYELSEIKGAREVTIEAGAIRFAGEPGRGLQIEAPWVVDASGKRREGAVKWELSRDRGDGSRRLSLVLVEGANLSYPAVIDPSWSTTGAAATTRYRHTATLLRNGKVLVAGGDGSTSDRYLSSAELYDPAAGTWSGTGALATGRNDHTATLLPNGKVLVVGGNNFDFSSGYLSSAELYDPAAGTWSGTGALASARSNHTATLLPNGKVLVAGGQGSGGHLSSAELYDPAAATWSTTGALATARYGHTATLLPSGKVLVAGGRDNINRHSSAELYDPATGTWSGTGALATARTGHTATLLTNGKVLVAGGSNSSAAFLNSAELYDPATGTWSGTGALATGRSNHTATLLRDGKVLVAGGIQSGQPGGPLSSAELYDPAAGTWSATAALATGRWIHTATLLPNGKVLVAGGQGNSGILSSAELYDPTPPVGLVGNVSTRLPVGTDDNVLIEGFIVQGPVGSIKKILVRAIGPSLIPFGIPDAVQNPTLEIRDPAGVVVAMNNDWKTTQVGGIITGDQSAEIAASGVAPGNDLESAIIANLAPGSYTAVVRGLGNTTGTGVVDAYDLSAASPAKLANIATRGLIQPGDKLMIAGFIIQNAPVRAVVRAIGPSLIAFGITNALSDTTLQLRDINGVIVRENDDWKTDQQPELEATGLQPSDDREAALVHILPPGQYTAQVRGKPETTGTGVVQVYFLD